MISMNLFFYKHLIGDGSNQLTSLADMKSHTFVILGFMGYAMENMKKVNLDSGELQFPFGSY